MSPKVPVKIFPKGTEIIFVKDNALKTGFITVITANEEDVVYKVDMYFGESGEVCGSQVVVSTNFDAMNAIQDLFYSKKQ